MSPTVFRQGPYRFFFLSREEERVHVHVLSPDGEAKFWLEPTVALAHFEGFNQRQLKLLHQIVEEHEHEIATLVCRNTPMMPKAVDFHDEVQ